MGQGSSKSANKNPKRQINAPLHINLLPEELIIYIFSFFDVKTLGFLARVSTFWKALAEEDMLWKTLHEKHFPAVKNEGNRQAVEVGGLDNKQPHEQNENPDCENHLSYKELFKLAEQVSKELLLLKERLAALPLLHNILPLNLPLVQPFQLEPLVLPNILHNHIEHRVPLEIFQHERQLSPTRSHSSLFSEFEKIHRQQLSLGINLQIIKAPETEVFYYEGKPNFTRPR